MKDVYVVSRMFFAGFCEEYNVRRILFDISGFREDFGPGSPVLLIQRPGEEQSYPISPYVEGDYAVWIPQQRDTDIPGSARVVLQWYTEDGLAISAEYCGRISGEKSSTGEVPEAEERWYREVLQAGEDARGYARDAQEALSSLKEAIAAGDFTGEPGCSPRINASGYWETYDSTSGTWVDTGVFAGGENPRIGANGNWFIGSKDTGVSATGPKGEDGADGAAGKSAYQCAVDGGYSGTEAEFYAKLASGAAVVMVTDNNGTLSTDKTYLEILRYFSAGIPVYVHYNGVILSFIAYSGEVFLFGAIACVNDGDGDVSVETNIIAINVYNEVSDISAGIERMPNPNALTIKIGDTTVTYDGSEAKTVTIADGSEVSY